MTNGEYKIEKGIPFPLHANAKYPFASMEIGDSIVLPLAAQSAAINHGKHRGRKYASRRVSATEVRIWRLS